MPRLTNGLEQVLTNLGIVGSGYKLYFFETGTSTPKTTYTTDDFDIPNTNPVVLNAAGRPDTGVWGVDSSLYRMVLGTPSSTISTVLASPVVDVDPVDVTTTNNIAGLTPIPTAYWGTTAGTSSNYTLDPALVDITSYSNTQTFFIDFHIACAANPTININDLGVINLKKYTGRGTKIGLLNGDAQPQRHECINDGTDIVILDPRTILTYLGNPPVIEVATNTLTITNAASSYNVDTGSAAQTINTISGLTSGQTAMIGISSSSYPATFASGVGNIINPSGLNVILSTINDKLTIYNDGTNNIIIGISSAGTSPIQLLKTQTAASSSSISFTNLTSSFSKYIIEAINIIPSASAPLQAFFSIDNGANYSTSNYQGVETYAANGVGLSSIGASSARIDVTYNNGSSQYVSSGTTNGASGQIILFNPSNASTYKQIECDMNWRASGGENGGGVSRQIWTGSTSAVNAIKIQFSGANIASGIFKLYGVL